MKAIVLLLALVVIATLAAADDTDFEDLGVITAKVGIVLEKETSRSDWSHFVIEFQPMTPPTNAVTLTLTNDFVTLSNLVKLPSGRTLMGLKSVFRDGTESKIILYKLDIRRADPPAPKARTIQILDGSAPEINSLSNTLRRLRESRPVIEPPAPPRSQRGPIPPAEAWPAPAVVPARVLRALPGGTNRTYAQHLDSMAEYYSRPGRRNEK